MHVDSDNVVSLAILTLENNFFNAVLVGVLGQEDPLGPAGNEVSVVIALKMDALELLLGFLPLVTESSGLLRDSDSDHSISLQFNGLGEVIVIELDKVAKVLWFLLGPDDNSESLFSNSCGLLGVHHGLDEVSAAVIPGCLE